MGALHPAAIDVRITAALRSGSGLVDKEGGSISALRQGRAVAAM